MERRILALDPANRTGWACVGRDGRRLYGAWQVAKAGDSHPGARLRRFRDGLRPDVDKVLILARIRKATETDKYVFSADCDFVIELNAEAVRRAAMAGRWPMSESQGERFHFLPAASQNRHDTTAFYNASFEGGYFGKDAK